jgi:hypothetical protein
MEDGRAEKQHQRPHPSTASDFLDGRDNRTQVLPRFLPSAGHGTASTVNPVVTGSPGSSRAMTAMDENAARYTFSGDFAGSW